MAKHIKKRWANAATQTSSKSIIILKDKVSIHAKTRSQTKEIGQYWKLDSINKWIELAKKFQEMNKYKLRWKIRLEPNPMKLIEELDNMMDQELLRRCSGDNECRVGSGYHKCKVCRHAIKCRHIVHHIQYMRHDGFDETDFLELLELF